MVSLDLVEARRPHDGPADDGKGLPLALAAVLAPAALFFALLGRAGIWDPHELATADLARRAAVHVFGASHLVLEGAENRLPTLGDLGRNELPITSIALSFKLFGLSEAAGRLPLALYATCGVAVLFFWLRRMVSARLGLFATLVLCTTPLYFVHARTMLGDIVTMASLVASFAGLSVLALEPPSDRRGPLWPWAVVASLGLVGGFMSRGGLVGVAVPTLSIAATSAIVGLNDAGDEGPSPLARMLTAGCALVGLVALVLGVVGLEQATPNAYSVWAGAAVSRQAKYPTFDAVVSHLGHAAYPWSALFPLAAGRLLLAPPGDSVRALSREQRLRVLLLCGLGLAYGVHGYMAPRTGLLPFSAVGLFAAVIAVALHDFERGAHPSRALAAASTVLAGVLYFDLVRQPDKALVVFGVTGATFPDSFKAPARQLVAFSVVLFGALLVLSFMDGHDDRREARESRDGSALERLSAIREVRDVLDALNQVWAGNLAFVAVMVEAMLVGLGALLFFGERFHLKLAVREALPQGMKTALINAWWVAPLALVGGLFAALTARKLFRAWLASSGVPRAYGALAAGVSAGLLLSLGYYPALADQLSPREVFEAYRATRKGSEPLGLLGVAGRSAVYYTGGDARPFADAPSAFAWLTEGNERRFLAVRADDLGKLNAMFRAAAREGKASSPDHNLPVLDARSSQTLLVSNVLGDAQKNQSPLAPLVGITPPRPAHPVEANLNDELMALGYDIFDEQDQTTVDSVTPGKRYVLRFYFRVLASPTTQWRAFIHIDGYGRRFNGDHELFDGKYAMTLWQPGDIITDRYEMRLEPNFAPGTYQMYFGFFLGERRLQVKSGRHHDNRIDGGPVIVR